MLLRFTKMHGLGNDFMMVDLISQRASLHPNLIQELSDRKLGIGFDQLLTVRPPENPELDFKYTIYNADGTEAEQCGNGTRCVTALAHLLEERNARIAGSRGLGRGGSGARLLCVPQGRRLTFAPWSPMRSLQMLARLRAMAWRRATSWAATDATS